MNLNQPMSADDEIPSDPGPVPDHLSLPFAPDDDSLNLGESSLPQASEVVTFSLSSQ